MITVQVIGDMALFSEPLTRMGGEKYSYPIPTYGSLVGTMESIYWKPSIVWCIDELRIMNKIQRESISVKTLHTSGSGNDLCKYTYLKNVCYQVKAHFEWSNKPEYKNDRNSGKHISIIKRALKVGGRFDCFLGTRECQCNVMAYKFGRDVGYYDNKELEIDSLMFHSYQYKNKSKFVCFWRPIIKNGVIRFIRPEECNIVKKVR